jgi:hypothetical protein
MFMLCLACQPVHAQQQLLDRVVARVEGQAITLSDAKAAVGLGIVEPRAGEDPIEGAIRGLIERALVLAEVARFSPPEPDLSSLNGQIALLKANAGDDLHALMRATGLDDQRIREIARDSLRIRAYINQRFGSTMPVSDEDVAQYYRSNPDEFQRDGRLIPFPEAEPRARQRVAAERREAIITQWLRDLRARAEVVELFKK